MTTPAAVAAAAGENFSPYCCPALATYRLPLESNARACGIGHAGGVGGAGRGAPRRELAHRMLPSIGHVQVAAGVEGQAVGEGHTGGVGSAWAWCSPARTSHRIVASVGHVQVAAGVEGQGCGTGHAGGVGGAGAWCCPAANSLTVLPLRWPRTDCRWSRRPGRRDRSRRRVGGAGRGAARRELAHRVAAELATYRLPLESKARASGSDHAGGVAWRWAWCCPARTRSPCCCRCWPRTGCRWSRRPGRRAGSMPAE